MSGVRRAAVAAGTGAAFGPGAARAHDLAAGEAGGLGDGVAEVLASPGLILPLAALALALGLWRADGLRRAGPHFLVASMAGLGLAPVAGTWTQAVPLGIGLVLAGLAALVPLVRVGPALPWLAALLGIALGAAALAGHGFAEVGWAMRAGVVGAASGALAGIAGAVAVSRAWASWTWVTILWRVAASWVAAIQLLVLAVLLRG